jgi:hypothetical protein
MSIKNSAWKDALAFFAVMLAVSFGWHLIGGPKESIGHVFGVAALAATLVYVFKRRKDFFD